MHETRLRQLTQPKPIPAGGIVDDQDAEVEIRVIDELAAFERATVFEAALRKIVAMPMSADEIVDARETATEALQHDEVMSVGSVRAKISKEGGLVDDAHQAEYLTAVSALASEPGIRRVLDAPCGSGYGSEILSRLGCCVVGADYSRERIDLARYRAQRAWPMLLDLNDLVGSRSELGEGTFDGVVCIEGLEHVADAGELLKTFGLCLRDGGLLVFSTPHAKRSRLSQGHPNPFHIKEYVEIELIELIEKAGFQRVRWLHDPATSAVILGIAIR